MQPDFFQRPRCALAFQRDGCGARGYALGAAVLLYFVLWLTVIRGLPSADKLLTYQPPLPTMVRRQ